MQRVSLPLIQYNRDNGQQTALFQRNLQGNLERIPSKKLFEDNISYFKKCSENRPLIKSDRASLKNLSLYKKHPANLKKLQIPTANNNTRHVSPHLLANQLSAQRIQEIENLKIESIPLAVEKPKPTNSDELVQEILIKSIARKKHNPVIILPAKKLSKFK